MRQILTILFLLGSFALAFASDAATGRVIKVLPLFLDRAGHDATSPSLFDRDAYQAYLRQHTNDISAVRFDVLWKASHARNSKLTLRVELRGIDDNGLPTQTTLEQKVTPYFFRHWNFIPLDGNRYKKFGQLMAWRVTLWNGDQLLGDQKSFLW